MKCFLCDEVLEDKDHLLAHIYGLHLTFQEGPVSGWKECWCGLGFSSYWYWVRHAGKADLHNHFLAGKLGVPDA